MTTAIDLQASLTAIVGPDHVQAADDTSAGEPAPWLVSPASAEEAARVLALAHETMSPVVFAGGNTGQRIGWPAGPHRIVLSTARLDRIVEWEPTDLTVCVEAGRPLGGLQQALATQGQQVAIEAPAEDRATVGGLVATGTSGPRRWQFGGWRDLVIGMHMALAGGTAIKSGGRVVKNVQGYDMAKLFTGSLGALGLITQVNLRLAPLPQTRRLLVARGPVERVAAFLEAVAASTARVSALDLLDEASAEGCGLAGTAAAAGLVLVEGRAVVVNAQVDAITRGADVRVEDIDGAALVRIWTAWRDLGRTVDLTPNEALLSVTTLPSQVEDVLTAITSAAQQHGCTARSWARAGNGQVFARLTAHADAGTALPATQAALLTRWPATTLTAGDAAVARGAQPWGAEPAGLPIMKALKRRFDPGGILQPGRSIAG